MKAIPFEELEEMRMETDIRLKELEQQYWGKKDSAALGSTIRDKYKSYGNDTATAPETPGPAKTEALDAKPSMGILKTASTPGGPGSLAKPKFGGAKVGGASRSKSKKKERSPSPLDYNDPRQQIYEAKFEKYLANKKARTEHDKKRQSMLKEDFDIYTKGAGSPSKQSKRCSSRPDPTDPSFSGKYNADDLLGANARGGISESEIKKA